MSTVVFAKNKNIMNYDRVGKKIEQTLLMNIFVPTAIFQFNF